MIRPGGLLVLTIALGWSARGGAAGIRQVTKGPISVTKGDQVVLSVEPNAGDASVEWWSPAGIVCESVTCELDTTSFTPGEYRYYVAVKDGTGIEIASVTVAATSAPPLYKPKKVTPSHFGPNADDSYSANGEWLIIPRVGVVSYSRKSSGRKNGSITFVEKPTAGLKYRVSPGGIAIVRRVGFAEEWLLTGNATFRFDPAGISLLSGSGIWRKLDQVSGVSTGARIYGVSVESKGDQLVAATSFVNRNGDLKSRIRNLEGTPITLQCSKDRELQISSPHAVEVESAVNCNMLSPDAEKRSGPTLALVSPWWIADGDRLPIDRWRAEYKFLGIPPSNQQSFQAAIAAASKAGHCSEVLDLAAGNYSQTVDIAIAKARCQLTFGLYEEALKNLKKFETQEEYSALRAYLLARAYHELGQFQLALDWYKVGLERGFEDRSGLSRDAVAAARAGNFSLLQLKWLDSAVLAEVDEQKVDEAVKTAGDWRSGRPSGGWVEFGGYVDSQVIPLNPKKAAVLPNNAKTTRAVVIATDGEWWSVNPLTRDAQIALLGVHNITWPTGPRLAPFAISKHEIRLGLIQSGFIGVTNSGGSEDISSVSPHKWSLHPSFVLGTGFLGPSRVRDRMGWAIDVVMEGESIYSVALSSDKYLDPNPGGTDYVDIDLFRYTTGGDFSHFTSMVRGSVRVPAGSLRWGADLSYGRTDYRASDFGAWDHDAMNIGFNLDRRLGRSAVAFFGVEQSLINYKQGGGRETKSSVEANYAWRFRPLWLIKSMVRIENRAITADPLGSWMRQNYGLLLSTDF